MMCWPRPTTLAPAAVVWMLIVHSLGAGEVRSAAHPVWIDTDSAAGEPLRDVDDGFAVLQALGSPELDVRGLSVVFGNASLGRAVRVAHDLVGEVRSDMPVVAGATDASMLGLETGATRALIDALDRGPLTLVALGPITNIATVLMRRPDLAARITRIVAVAGRRPGQRFTVGTRSMLAMRDFNFELDPAAFRVVLASQVPLVLAPFEIASKVWITEEDLDRLATGPPAARRLADPARAWLTLWTHLYGVNGFNPFDTLAVGLAVSQDDYGCEGLPVAIASHSGAGSGNAARAPAPQLLASKDLASVDGRALYCHTPPATFKQTLLSRITK